MSLLGRFWVETPKYTVISTGASPAYEIRRYPKMIVAKTFIPKNTPNFNYSMGFRTIANFIFGNNKAVDRPEPEKISMTTPVGHFDTGDGVWMNFVMPSKYTMETLPKPQNPDVVIEEIETATMAAITFSGAVDQDLVDQQLAQLRAALDRDGIKVPEGARMRLHQYDPPWVPFFWRKNEVLLPVSIQTNATDDPNPAESN